MHNASFPLISIDNQSTTTYQVRKHVHNIIKYYLLETKKMNGLNVIDEVFTIWEGKLTLEQPKFAFQLESLGLSFSFGGRGGLGFDPYLATMFFGVSAVITICIIGVIAIARYIPK